MVAGLNALLNNVLDNRRNRAGIGTDGVARLPASGRNASPSTRNTGSAGGDSIVLSQPLKVLSDMGVELGGSSFREEAQFLSFSLQFQDTHVQSLSAGGSFDLRSQTLQVDFSFRSFLTVKDETTGEEHRELFQFDCHLEASHIQAELSDRKVEKEDILQFARKILNKMSKLHAEGKEIDGLALDGEDLMDLGSLEEGRLLKSILQVIHMLRNLDRLRGSNGQHQWLSQERGKALVTETNKKDEHSSKTSLNVRRVSADVPANVKTEAAGSEDATPDSLQF